MITYFNVLLIFIIPPIILLGILTKLRADEIKINSLDSKTVLFILSIIAFVYTTPWDNYLVAEGIWYYDEELISGIIYFWVPLEEYMFFILETILVSLLFLNLHSLNSRKQISPLNNINNSRSYRLIGFLILIAMWLGSFFLLINGSSQYTYLTLILVWALIPIALQVGYGADIISQNYKSVSLTIVISTLYLSLVDAFAINSGTWTIASKYSLSSYKLGIMPLEEILFFFLTSVLVTFGMLLGTEYKSRIRLLLIIESLRKKNYRFTPIRS